MKSQYREDNSDIFLSAHGFNMGKKWGDFENGFNHLFLSVERQYN